jgi:multidrug efflux pump subunit AcrB
MALRFRFITFAIVILVMGLGGVAATQLQQELLPPIEFPQSFILVQVSGMTSEQVLNVVTIPVEEALLDVPGVVNIESTTTGSFGIFMTVAIEFGIDQDTLRAKMQAALNAVPFPVRAIHSSTGESAETFATGLLADMTPDVMLYLARTNRNFLFQLSPDVWSALPDETVETLLAYLAGQLETSAGHRSALEQLVDAEILPQVSSLELVARVSVDGGQALPGDEAPGLTETAEDTEPRSRLFQLSADVWELVAPRLSLGELNQATVDALSAVEVTAPQEPPILPESWQMDHFNNASDLAEMTSLTRNMATVINDFLTTGEIRGSLAMTDDLTPEAVQIMLNIDPTLALTFEADQLAAMPPEILALLPTDLEFDGFTRDALASSALARDLTGSNTLPDPVALPAAWRINPPQIITFSFADLPLATFSIFSTAAPETIAVQDTPETVDTTEPVSQTETSDPSGAPALNIGVNPQYADLSEGPALPGLYTFIGTIFQYDLNTADDLLKMQFPPETAALFGGTDGVAFLNLLPQLAQFGALGGGAASGGGGIDASAMAQLAPALAECNISLLQLAGGNLDPIATGMISCLSPEVMGYFVEQDPTFGRRLSSQVYANLSPEIFAIDGYSPPLADAWDTLAGRPEFTDRPLQNADDLLSWGNGSPSEFLNKLNRLVPERFAGYEIRLFDSLSPQILAYIVAQESDFYINLDSDVLLKFSPESLAVIPEESLAKLPETLASETQAIASGEVSSAAATIASEYASDVPPARDNAPALNEQWKELESFFPGTEFNNAYDPIRFSDAGLINGPPANFINGFFNTANGANFAIGLLGNMPKDAFDYLAQEDPTFIDGLSPRALNLLPENIFNELSQSTRERALAGEVFVPSNAVTRMNGSSSLLVTVYKPAGANTVEAYHQAADVITAIDEANPNISVQVAFEQASFIEESISGVVLSGILGAFFAIVNILIFLSGDIWSRRGRSIAGVVVTIISVILMIAYYVSSGSSFDAMVKDEAVLIFFLILFGIGAGIFVLFWPGRLPYPSWRSTLVIAVSIPLSIMAALALMNWLPGIMQGLLGGYKDNALVAFILRLAPEGLTLNIMTLSGLTVAVGRLVDDSIVVLENIFRQLQEGNMEKREAVLYATRDVSVAIFSATSIAVLVFLPLGMTGGLIAEFFLPFGLAVTYTLLSSFLVAITVVPALAYTIISAEHMPQEEETWMQKFYVPILAWILSTTGRRWTVIILAVLSVGLSAYLFSQRPAAFLPNFGEPQLSINVEMPTGTGIIVTNERVAEIEGIINDVIPAEDLSTVRTSVGSGGAGLETLFGGGGVSETIANITISISDSDKLDQYAESLRQEVESLFAAEDENVTITTGTATGEGFGGFELVVSGSDQATLEEYDAQIIASLESLPELSNVISNLTSNGDEANQGSPTFIRVCSDGACSPALTYTGELDTEDTINFTTRAIETVQAEVEFPEGMTIGQGFSSELQTEGFSSIFTAMGIASVMIVLILLLVFRSPVYWFAVFFSVIVAPVGAAIALSITNRVLGISSLIGLLMLLGLVVTNAIVLIDRVGSNRTERGMNLYDALVEAGGRRLRPILMTALTTIIGLFPLALGLSEGAIIAAELGTVVIGGVISSTLLMLIVVPSAYYLFTPIHDFFVGLVVGKKED